MVNGAQSGWLTVSDASLRTLGAHPGHGGQGQWGGDRVPSNGWQWNAEGRNVCIPTNPNLPAGCTNTR